MVKEPIQTAIIVKKVRPLFRHKFDAEVATISKNFIIFLLSKQFVRLEFESGDHILQPKIHRALQ